MRTTPKLGRTLRLCTAIICMVGLSACPGDDEGPGSDAGTPNGEAGSAAGTGGQSTPGTGGKPAAGSGGAAAGKGGASAGTGGKPAAGSGGHSAGKGGSGTSDEDAGMDNGKLCGTRGAGSCEADEFCNFEPDKDCGATDRGGSCEAKPDICTADFTPVCGCDDKTYSNACSAHAAGVSVKANGECGAAGGGGGATCGGIASLECAGANEFCNYEAGQGCDGTISDAAGKCEAMPGACTKEYKPVCSCDRKSHGNKCEANSMGASVLHDGVCTVSDCEYLGGRVAIGTGPAAMCESDEVEHTYLINDDGSMAIEGMLCCLKK